MFGGSADNGDMNEVWIFDLSALQWTWVAGAAILEQPGHYGTQCATVPRLLCVFVNVSLSERRLHTRLTRGKWRCVGCAKPRVCVDGM